MGKSAKDRKSKEKRARKRDRMERVLRTLGLWEYVEQLPPILHNKVTISGLKVSYRVEAGEGMEGHEEVVKAVRREGEEATLKGEGFEHIKLLEAMEVVFRMLTVFHGYGPEKLATMPARFVEPIETLKGLFTENVFQILVNGLSWMSNQGFVRYSRCTETMFWSTMTQQVTLPYLTYTIRVYGATPASRELDIEGNRRMVWRCGCWIIAESRFEWISWPEERLSGAPGNEGRILPVYVQDHALRQLSARMNFKTDVAIGGGHHWLGQSLRNPVILPYSEDRYLVEFKFGDKTTGYLVAKAHGDCIVIATFLFLTMQGTPQSQKLRERLGVGRQTIEYLNLDKLETFRNPAIRNDEQLVAILSECDCGHLFKVADKEPEDTAYSSEQAALCRKVLFPQEAVAASLKAESTPILNQFLEALLYRKKH